MFACNDKEHLALLLRIPAHRLQCCHTSSYVMNDMICNLLIFRREYQDLHGRLVSKKDIIDTE